MTRLYEIYFIDAFSVQHELDQILTNSIDILSSTKKALIISAYQIEERRRLTNRLFKEKQKVWIDEETILWAYFSPEQTKRKQIVFRSFIVKELVYVKNKIIVKVRLTYEKSKQWFDLKLNLE